MLNIKTLKSYATICLSLTLVLISFATSAKATENNNISSDYGLPTHRRDGGSRGLNHNCLADARNQNLVALIPEKTVGINASASPKLFFYVPKTSTEQILEFVLRNERDELMYEAFLTTEGDGIMSIEVPGDVRANLFDADQNYRWYLSLICNAQQRSRDIVVEGWMRQSTIDVATKQELNTATPVEQAELYHQQGFWYDALSVLASDRQSATAPPVVRAKWTELLDSVGLEELAAKPFVESKLVEVDSQN